MVLNITLLNYNCLFDNEYLFEFDKKIDVTCDIYKLESITEIIMNQIQIKNNLIFEVFVCSDNLEPYISNSIKINDKDEIAFNTNGKIVLTRKSKNFIK